MIAVLTFNEHEQLGRLFRVWVGILNITRWRHEWPSTTRWQHLSGIVIFSVRIIPIPPPSDHPKYLVILTSLRTLIFFAETLSAKLAQMQAHLAHKNSSWVRIPVKLSFQCLITDVVRCTIWPKAISVNNFGWHLAQKDELTRGSLVAPFMR